MSDSPDNRRADNNINNINGSLGENPTGDSPELVSKGKAHRGRRGRGPSSKLRLEAFKERRRQSIRQAVEDLDRLQEEEQHEALKAIDSLDQPEDPGDSDES